MQLTVDGVSQTQPLTIVKHPLRDTSDAAMQEQFDLSVQIRDKVSEANQAVIEIRRIKDAVADRLKKSDKRELKLVGDRLVAALSAVEGDIYQVKNQSGQDPLNFPIRINNRLASLYGVVARGDGKPIDSARPIFEDLKKELEVEMKRLESVLASDLPAFNVQLQRVQLPPVGEPIA